MAELGFVLLVAVLNGAGATVLGRSDARPAPEGDQRWRFLGAVAIGLGLIILRFGGVFGPASRSRALLAIGAIVVGLGAALLSSAARAHMMRGASLRAFASSTVAPLTIVATVVAVLLMLLTRAAALTAVPAVLFGFALGAAIGTLLASPAGDPFPLLAVATATVTSACTLVALHNRPSFPAFQASALIALGPLVPLLAAIALTAGALSVRADGEEDENASVLRGFAVSAAVSMLAVIAASHWWARPTGRGGWLALPAFAATMGSVVVLLVGRYYDDPTMRAGRAIARARRGGPITRRRVGARIGAESALLVMLVASAVGYASFRAAEVLSLAGGGPLGVAIAVAGCLGSFGFLDAIAAGRDARTLAHDVLLVSLCSIALLSRSIVALAAVPIAIALVVASVLERVAAASEPDEHSLELRRRAAILPVVASGMLAAAATLGSLLGEL